MLSLYIVLIVALLTVLIGASSMKDAYYNKKKAKNIIGKYNDPELRDLYNVKCNSLSLYGYLAIVYGVIILAICVYNLMNQGNVTNMGVGIIGGIGAIFTLLSITDKIREPNPV